METTMRPVATLFTLGMMLAAMPAAAQQGLGTTKPDAELMNYRLSMEKLHKLVDVQRSLNTLNAKNPKVFETIDREYQTAAKKNGGPLTVSQKAAIIERYPEAQRMLSSSGTTPRDWLLTLEAMGDAYIWIETKKGTLRGSPPTTDAQKANVALLEKNQAEFQKIMEELDKLMDEMLSQ
jgi:hypothetical protein